LIVLKSTSWKCLITCGMRNARIHDAVRRRARGAANSLAHNRVMAGTTESHLFHTEPPPWTGRTESHNTTRCESSCHKHPCMHGGESGRVHGKVPDDDSNAKLRNSAAGHLKKAPTNRGQPVSRSGGPRPGVLVHPRLRIHRLQIDLVHKPYLRRPAKVPTRPTNQLVDGGPAPSLKPCAGAAWPRVSGVSGSRDVPWSPWSTRR
jgi:hypothetical protein